MARESMKSKTCQVDSAPRFLASLANSIYSHAMEKSPNMMCLPTPRKGPRVHIRHRDASLQPDCGRTRGVIFPMRG
jgi:hypothetical protein